MPLSETIWTGQVVLVALAALGVIAFIAIVVAGFRDMAAWQRTERYLEHFAEQQRRASVRVRTGSDTLRARER